ncbi:MAG: threonylcarbamoyl-AMP synthase [Acidobacteria bacterium]|nr:threonylcarbamoyl-AMP synthase [Acidobacteriota bacterium]
MWNPCKFNYLIVKELPLSPSRIANISDTTALARAARIIRAGGLVAFPTETVYGLGADAENPLAVAGIFDVKARPRIDPIIVHVSDIDMANKYGVFPQRAHKLMEMFWPGPLTLVVPKTSSVPSIVTAGLETVAIRIPSHPVALDLIRTSGCAIAAPSANPFGYVSPTEAQHVAEQLSDSVDMILDGGPCPIGLESTILSLVGVIPCILRPGGTPVEELAAILQPLDTGNIVSKLPQAPGQLQRHYATLTPLDIVEEGHEDIKQTDKVGLISYKPVERHEKYETVIILSETGDMREAAANLFRSLRRLDALKLDKIIVHPVPEKGLGIAIMDRLRRCSAGRKVADS